MSERLPRGRKGLAAFWAAFVLAWVAFAVFALGATSLLPCGGDGGSPYAAPESPAGRYCDAVDAYFDAGEPGELTTALVYLWPVLALAGVGAYGVWKRRRRLLLAVAVVAVAIVAIHLTLPFALPDRCSPDDPSVLGCDHY